VRSQASMESAIVARLKLGEQVDLIQAGAATTDANSVSLAFCEIEYAKSAVTNNSNSPKKTGFIACQYLSEQAVTSLTAASSPEKSTSTLAGSVITPRLAAPAISSSELRYVVGSSVNLRTQPDLKADVLARMPINSKLRLLSPSSVDKSTASASRFCEVEFFSGQLYRGYTACQYLSEKPLLLEKISNPTLADGRADPSHNPERAFWLQPSIGNLFAYGSYLEATRMTEAERTTELKNRRPNMRLRKIVPEFEAMKAKLTQGYIEPESLDTANKAIDLKNWNQIKTDVAKVWPEFDAQRLMFKQRMRGRDYNDSKWSEINKEDNSALKILENIRAKVEINGKILSYSGVPLYGLIHKIELPPASVSFFNSAADFVHHGVGVNQGSSPISSISSLWKIPMNVQFIRGGHHVEPGHYDDGHGSIAASWDIGTATASLAQPVWMNTLSSSGKIEKSSQKPSANLEGWRTGSEDDCPGGFLYSEPASTFDGNHDFLGIKPYSRVNTDFKMVGFYTRTEIKRDAVKVSQRVIRLDLAETGFFSARVFTADIDGDGVSDFALIEAVEPASDYIHFLGDRNAPFPTKRLYVFNVAGKWEIYAKDDYVFGCGC
jgi:hypothetical protein